MNEIWKPIKGYDGIYEVSSLGRVRSLDRHIVRKNDADYRLKGRILTLKRAERWRIWIFEPPLRKGAAYAGVAASLHDTFSS